MDVVDAGGGPWAQDGRLRLPWLDPNERVWVVAVPRRGADGTHRNQRDRRGRLKINAVDLIRAGPPDCDRAALTAPPDASELDGSHERWLLGATRRSWAAITSRFGAESLGTAMRLIDQGAIELRVPVAGAFLDLGHPICWRLTDEWRLLAEAAKRSRADRRGRAAEEAISAADAVAHLDPELAQALRSGSVHSLLLPVLVAAALDLASGIRHDAPGPSPRFTSATASSGRTHLRSSGRPECARRPLTFWVSDGPRMSGSVAQSW